MIESLLRIWIIVLVAFGIGTIFGAGTMLSVQKTEHIHECVYLVKVQEVEKYWANGKTFDNLSDAAKECKP